MDSTEVGTSELGAFDTDGAYVTQATADAYYGGAGGLPNDGYFAATTQHPAVDFDWSGTNNAWKVSEPGNVSVAVQDGQYNEVHVFAATAQNRYESADFKVGFTYSDGTTTFSKTFKAIDWYLDAGEDGWPSDPDGYYLTNDNDRWNLGDDPDNHDSNDHYENNNEVAIFGFGIQIDSSKTLNEVIIDVIDKGPTNKFAFFGGTATTDTTDTAEDFIGPDINITSPVESIYQTTGIDITADISDTATTVASATAEIDGTTNISLTQDGTTWSNSYVFSNGEHIVKIYATDANGNTNTKSVSITVDTEGPVIDVQEPLNQTYTYDPSLQVIVSDTVSIDTVLAEIDGVTNITLPFLEGVYSAPYEFNDGSHSIRFIANDTLGHISATTSTVFSIDTSGPILSIMSPTNTSYTSNPTIIAEASDVVNSVDTVQVKIDGTYYDMVKSDTTYTYDFGFADGTHTIEIIANDSLGQSTIKQVTFTVDSTGPQVTFQNPTNQTYLIDTLDIDVDASDLVSDIVSVKAEIDDKTNITLSLIGGIYTNQYTFNDGSHTISIFVEDSMGHVTTQSVVFTIDTTGPRLVVISPQAQIYSTGSINLNISAVDDITSIDKVVVEINEMTNITLIQSGDTFTSDYEFEEGEHTIRFIANDTNGFYSVQEITFTVDLFGPDISSIEPNEMLHTSSSIDLSVTASDSMTEIVSVIVEIDSTTNVTLILEDIYRKTYNFDEGEHTLRFMVTDAAGHTTTQSLTIVIDLNGPDISGTFAEGQVLTQSQLGVNATVTDQDSSVDTVIVEIDSSVNLTLTSDGELYYSSYQFSDGDHSIRYIANDTQGHITVVIVLITVDTTNPIVESTSLENRLYTESKLDINATANDNVSEIDTVIAVINEDVTIELHLVNGIYHGVYSFTEGQHTVKIIANDTAGFEASTTVVISIDTVKPSVSITSPKAMEYNVTSISFEYEVSEVSLVTVYLNGSSNSTVMNSGYVYSDLIDGTYNLTVMVTDLAGNTGYSTVLFTINTTQNTAEDNSQSSEQSSSEITDTATNDTNSVDPDDLTELSLQQNVALGLTLFAMISVLVGLKSAVTKQ